MDTPMGEIMTFTCRFCDDFAGENCHRCQRALCAKHANRVTIAAIHAKIDGRPIEFTVHYCPRCVADLRIELGIEG